MGHSRWIIANLRDVEPIITESGHIILTYKAQQLMGSLRNWLRTPVKRGPHHIFRYDGAIPET